MRFQVPQFIDVEDKVIGPLSLKQFLYIAIAAGILAALYKLLNFFVFVLLAVPVAALAYALAFVKVHNQPFMNIIKNFLGFLKKPDFYIWKKPTFKSPAQETPQIIKTTKKKIRPKSKQRLQEIGWKINIEK